MNHYKNNRNVDYFPSLNCIQSMKRNVLLPDDNTNQKNLLYKSILFVGITYQPKASQLKITCFY